MAAGFIGSQVTAELLRRGRAVRVRDNCSTGKRANLAALGGEVELGKLVDAGALGRVEVRAVSRREALERQGLELRSGDAAWMGALAAAAGGRVGGRTSEAPGQRAEGRTRGGPREAAWRGGEDLRVWA